MQDGWKDGLKVSMLLLISLSSPSSSLRQSSLLSQSKSLSFINIGKKCHKACRYRDLEEHTIKHCAKVGMMCQINCHYLCDNTAYIAS